MHGEIRKGDTIGLWTYNDELHAEFPMQVWSREHKAEIISDVERYLRHQHYGKRAHIEKVYPAIGQAMQRSQRLTLIFIYDPSETLSGTAFDDDISDLQKDYLRNFNAAHLPMVTVLAARNGTVFDYTVNYPGAVKIPHTAIPEPPPQTNAPPTNAIAVTPPVVVAPKPHRHIEIIMSGTNNLSHSTAENVPSPVNAPPGSPNIIMAATPAPNTNTAAVSPAPPSTNAVTTVIAEPLPNTNAIAAPQELRVETTHAPNSVAITPVLPNVPPPAQKSEPTPQPPPQKAAVPTEAIAATTPATSPTPVANESSSAAPNPPPTESSKEEPLQHAQAAPVTPAIPPPVAATGLGQVELFVMAISLLTIAIVLVVLVVRRSRGHGQTSLISQSIDRDR
jgi:hypothetical protein